MMEGRDGRRRKEEVDGKEKEGSRREGRREAEQVSTATRSSVGHWCGLVTYVGDSTQPRR